MCVCVCIPLIAIAFLILMKRPFLLILEWDKTDNETDSKSKRQAVIVCVEKQGNYSQLTHLRYSLTIGDRYVWTWIDDRTSLELILNFNWENIDFCKTSNDTFTEWILGWKILLQEIYRECIYLIPLRKILPARFSKIPACFLRRVSLSALWYRRAARAVGIINSRGVSSRSHWYM